MKKILINATQKEELRVAIVENGTLQLFRKERLALTNKKKKGNIFLGVITSIKLGLDAAFVDYGQGRQGFLSFRDVHRDYAKGLRDPGGRNGERPAPLQVGQFIIVQIQREERGSKGVVLSTFASLADNQLVYMPNRGGRQGISKRIKGEERSRAEAILADLSGFLDPNEGIIIRTTGAACCADDLKRVIAGLRNVWADVKKVAEDCKIPALLYEDGNIAMQTVRDFGSLHVEVISVDEEECYNKIKKFVSTFSPQLENRVEFYRQRTPIFCDAHIEGQIRDLSSREIRLPSGGSVVFDRTEALTSVDVNSARSTRGSSIEETALNTNLEAAKEVAKHLQLRDIGGLLVVDFIDMEEPANNRKVEEMMRTSISEDKARIQIADISPLGLMEISRQWMQHSFHSASFNRCKYCEGSGKIEHPIQNAVTLVHLLQQEAFQSSEVRLLVYASVDVCNYLTNNKEDELQMLRADNDVQVNIFACADLYSTFYVKKVAKDAPLPLEVPDFSNPEDSQSRLYLDKDSFATRAPVTRAGSTEKFQKSAFLGNFVHKLHNFFTKKQEAMKVASQPVERSENEQSTYPRNDKRYTGRRSSDHKWKKPPHSGGGFH